MLRSTKQIAAIVAVGLALMATPLSFAAHASTVPTHGAIYSHAQPSSDLVWVADDNTAQALRTCTRSGLPCPPGSMQSLLIHTMPIAQAESEHRPYIALTPDHAAVDRYFFQVYPAPVASAPPTGLSPADCPQQTTYDNWSGTFGGQYTVYASYWGNEYCGGSQVQLISDRETHNNGPGIWRSRPASGYTGASTWVGDDSGGNPSCDGLGATYSFSGSPWTKDPGSDRINIEWSSGSNCSPFDTYESDNYGLY